jgi:hypothetical protein
MAWRPCASRLIAWLVTRRSGCHGEPNHCRSTKGEDGAQHIAHHVRVSKTCRAHRGTGRTDPGRNFTRRPGLGALGVVPLDHPPSLLQTVRDCHAKIFLSPITASIGLTLNAGHALDIHGDEISTCGQPGHWLTRPVRISPRNLLAGQSSYNPRPHGLGRDTHNQSHRDVRSLHTCHPIPKPGWRSRTRSAGIPLRDLA